MKLAPKTTRLDLNLAPMVDVMMCLLIFFMLATRMVEQENSQIDLPVAAASKEVEKQALGNRFVVNIRPADHGAQYIVRESIVAFTEVRDLLAIEAARDPGVNCVIRADHELPYRYVQAVMAACANARIQNVTFGALRSNGGGDGS